MARWWDDLEPESEEAERAFRASQQRFLARIRGFRTEVADRALFARYAFGPGAADSEEDLLMAILAFLHEQGADGPKP